MLFLERTSRTMAAFDNPDPLIRSSTGEPGLSLWRPLRAGAIPHQREVFAINAPTLHFGPIPARFFAPRTAPF
jgi:hypothetical protein